MPVRIQRKRTKGFKMPFGAIYVGRGSVWGNPFIVGRPSGVFPEGAGKHGKAETMIEALTLEQALEFYRNVVSGFLTPEMYPAGHGWADRFRKHYRQHPTEVARRMFRDATVVCWCAPDARCHGDILLAIAGPRCDPV